MVPLQEDRITDLLPDGMQDTADIAEQEEQAKMDAAVSSRMARKRMRLFFIGNYWAISLMKLKNKGCGCKTVLEYSGWNWVPINQR